MSISDTLAPESASMSIRAAELALQQFLDRLGYHALVSGSGNRLLVQAERKFAACAEIAKHRDDFDKARDKMRAWRTDSKVAFPINHGMTVKGADVSHSFTEPIG